MSLASRFQLIYVSVTQLRIHLADTALCSGEPPLETEAAPSFPEGETLPFLLPSHLCCGKPINLKHDILKEKPAQAPLDSIHS